MSNKLPPNGGRISTPDKNNDTTYIKSAIVDNLLNKSRFSFVNTNYSTQLTADYTIDSIVNVLETYGLSSKSNTWYQQAGPLVGQPVQVVNTQGTSVSISADGNTVVSNGPNPTNKSSYIFIRDETTWSQQALLDGNTLQGVSSSISYDGNTLIVGGSGYANIYIRVGVSWSLSYSLGVFTSEFGRAVAISGDGNTVAIGERFVGPNLDGYVYIYTKTGLTWTLQTFVQNDGPVYNTYFGNSISLSWDGMTLAIGGPNGAGGLWVFVSDGTNWTQQGPVLSNDINIGYSVDISRDGNTIVTGDPNFSSEQGACCIFVRNLNSWTQQGPKLYNSDIDNGRQGESVSINGSGDFFVSGAPSTDNTRGAAFMFSLKNGYWKNTGNILHGIGYDPSTFPSEGMSIGIAKENKTIIIGGPQAGAAWIFKKYD